MSTKNNKPRSKSTKPHQTLSKSTIVHKRFAQNLINTVTPTSGKINGKAAYRVDHPNTTDNSAEVAASRMLRNPKVQKELVRIVNGLEGMSRDCVNDHLIKAGVIAEKNEDATGLVNVAMSKAKLLGLVIDKSEVKTKTDELEPTNAMTELKRRGLIPTDN